MHISTPRDVGYVERTYSAGKRMACTRLVARYAVQSAVRLNILVWYVCLGYCLRPLPTRMHANVCCICRTAVCGLGTHVAHSYAHSRYT